VNLVEGRVCRKGGEQVSRRVRDRGKRSGSKVYLLSSRTERPPMLETMRMISSDLLKETKFLSLSDSSRMRASIREMRS
jgi:hypothetical protein